MQQFFSLLSWRLFTNVRIINWKLLHQVGDLFELNVKLRCQKVNRLIVSAPPCIYTRVWYESPVAIKRKVTSKRLLIGLASLILVSSYFILGPISCSSNSKSLAVILVKSLKRAQLSILTSSRRFKFRFRLSRKFVMQLFDTVSFYVQW